VASFLVGVIQLAVQLISLIIILHVLMSWFQLEPWHPVRRFLDQLAEPILRPFRNAIPPVGMFDLSPMVALIVIQIVGQVLIFLVAQAF
jgi:YggT family protein